MRYDCAWRDTHIHNPGMKWSAVMKRNAYWYLAVSILAAAAAVIAAGVVFGELHVGLLLFIPVIYGSSVPAGIAALLIFVAFILFAVSFGRSIEEGAETESLSPEERGEHATERRKSIGGVIFIGPVPIIFGSDRKIAWYMMVIAVVILVLIVIALLVGFL